jgi:threonine/homoserine/homoserine lactone efflux protein
MTVIPSLLAYSAAASILTITPGLDTALVLRAAAAEGPHAARRAALGIGAGCLVWGLLVAAGLAALLAVSAAAYVTLKLIGAVYLVWLGARLFFGGRLIDAGDGKDGESASFRRGFLTNMLNPKVGVFYVSFLPQFIPEGANVAAMTALMAGIHAALGLAWFSLLIAATRPIARVLAAPALAVGLDRAMGLLFVGLGVRLALEKAP